ncbi:MAG TPA: YggS family pyridoxal phosphate-dependent enzyme [Terriglobales bacterium]|nr:YggS family pyridoxal phosphate-dependent enzyme [Terriglobales bacterium]
MAIAQNISEVRERIDAAARRSGRQSEDVRLMAVSKTFPAEAILEAYEAEQRLFGENRVQEFASKLEKLHALAGVEWHLIGHLQSNKAGRAAEIFSAVDSVDSLRLAQRLDAAAAAAGKTLPVLIELNLGGEDAKTGLPPQSPELQSILDAAPQLGHLEIRGLMTVPPYSDDPEGARMYFRQLRQIRDVIAARNIPRVQMHELSMGMSHDFEVAIAEGSTCVRLGAAIFGDRK